MNPIDKLTEYFKKFPGIGERQARRFVYYLLKQNSSFLNDFSQKVTSLKKEISECPDCHIYFTANNQTKCSHCLNPNLDPSLLMIIEKDVDLENINRSSTYNGSYFILGSLIGSTYAKTETARFSEVVKKIEDRLKGNSLKEVILALSLSPQGDQTDLRLRELLSPFKEKYNLKISSLGRGLSSGLELEYSDSETLKNAIKNRQ